MKTYHLLLAMGVLLSSASATFGMATERIGPDKDQRFPTVAQPGWPAGMINILGHDSRVYSIDVNGNENFYFKANPGEIGGADQALLRNSPAGSRGDRQDGQQGGEHF